MLAHQPGQHFSRKDSGGDELDVRATIRHTRQGVRRGHQFFVTFDIAVSYWASPLGPQIVSHREIEHRVDGMLAFLLSNLLNRQTLVLQLEVAILDFAGDELVELTKNDIQGLHATTVVVFTHFSPEFRLRQFGFALFSRAERGFLPGRNAVKQVPVFQRHPDRCPDGGCLPEYPRPAFIGRVDPLELGLMRLGMLVADQNCVVQQRTASNSGHLFQEFKVVLNAEGVFSRSRLSKLDAAIIYLTHGFGHAVIELIRQNVGDHRRAIIVPLYRHPALGHQALG